MNANDGNRAAIVPFRSTPPPVLGTGPVPVEADPRPARPRSDDGDQIGRLDELAEIGPVHAPRSWLQLGVLVLDGSASMTWDLVETDTSIAGLPARTKAQAVDAAVRDLVSRLQASRKAPNFSIGMVSFTTSVTEARTPREVLAIGPTESFDPTAKGTGGTNVAAGLHDAHAMIQAFYASEAGHGVPLSSVVLVMTDGADSDPQAALAGAEALKRLPNTTVACCYFADRKGSDSVGPRLLQGMASGPTAYQSVYSAEQLRKFFLASMTAPIGGADALLH